MRLAEFLARNRGESRPRQGCAARDPAPAKGRVSTNTGLYAFHFPILSLLTSYRRMCLDKGRRQPRRSSRSSKGRCSCARPSSGCSVAVPGPVFTCETVASVSSSVKQYMLYNIVVKSIDCEFHILLHRQTTVATRRASYACWQEAGRPEEEVASPGSGLSKRIPLKEGGVIERPRLAIAVYGIEAVNDI